MDLKKIKKFIEVAKEGEVTKLSYEHEGTKLSVSFEAAIADIPRVSVQASSQPTKSSEKASNDNHHVVKAPFVGTFYSSSGPGEPAYVNVGDKVSKGQTLCILEAMKIMNEIEADASGTLVEICVDNESFVEFAQPLFKISKD